MEEVVVVRVEEGVKGVKEVEGEVEEEVEVEEEGVEEEVGRERKWEDNFLTFGKKLGME